jgi:hypothetical protein
VLTKVGGVEEDSVEEDEQEEDVKLLFMNKCKEYFYSILGFLPDSSLDYSKLKRISDSCIKGIVNPKKDNNVYVVLDADPILRFYRNKETENAVTENEETESKKNYLLATLHEIIYQQTIFNTPVSPIIVEFFSQNDCLLHIRNDDNVKIDNPFLLYSFDRNEGEKEEEKEEQEKGEEKPKEQLGGQRFSFLPELSENKRFGNCYYFSNIVSKNRYVVYLKDTKYVLPEKYSYSKVKDRHIKETEDNESIFAIEDEDDEDEEDDNYLSTYFQENNIPLWCVKTVDYFALLL